MQYFAQLRSRQRASTYPPFASFALFDWIVKFDTTSRLAGLVVQTNEANCSFACFALYCAPLSHIRVCKLRIFRLLNVFHGGKRGEKKRKEKKS